VKAFEPEALRSGIRRLHWHFHSRRQLPAAQPDRVGLDVPAEAGVIIAVPVVIEVGERARLTREAEDRIAAWRRHRARHIGGDQRHADMVGVDPVNGGASARSGDQRQRRITAHAIAPAERLAGAADRRTQPDGLGNGRARPIIFADQASAGIVDEAVRGRSAGDRDPLVEPVMGTGLARIAGAGVAQQPAQLPIEYIVTVVTVTLIT